MSQPVTVECPCCNTTFPIPDKQVKLAVKRELLSTDSTDFEVPIRGFIHALLDNGGDEKLVKVIYRMLRSKKSTGPVRLRALEIITSCMKHQEKMRPVPKDLKLMDAKAIERFLDQKLGIETEGEVATATAEGAPPGWMQQLEQADG